ncbi:MAG: electron transfer flavoprotein subunit alpha/FixB family protein [Acidobacteria bacterium]|nr:electron transfer flavoprotein subunit alpha/FixB family protein [Acidobacteriota bacterium]
MNSLPVSPSPAPPLVLVFAETLWGKLERLSFELLADARKLAASVKGRVEVVLFTTQEQRASLLEELLAHVREPIHLVEHENFAEYSTESYTSGLVQLLQVLQPNLLFLGATTYGRDFAPRVAARLGYAYFPHCLLSKTATGGKLDITRVTHGGRVHIQTNWPLAAPAILTMKAGVADAPAAEKTPPNPQVTSHALKIAAGKVRLKKRIPPDPRTLDIRQAEKLVSGGRGVGNKENFAVLRALADALGASLAASRAAVDLGWVEYERQVGQTGKTVTPRLYLAAGISGASHHLMGMRDAGKIVVVNTDRQAPIFSVAHFGVLGDLHAVLPRLTERIQADKKKATPATSK